MRGEILFVFFDVILLVFLISSLFKFVDTHEKTLKWEHVASVD